MKLRVAKKVCNNMNAGHAARYKHSTQHLAVNRIEKTQSAKQTDLYWHRLMDYLGIMGRASIVFDLKMRDYEISRKASDE